APFQLLVANLAYDNYVGKYAIGRVLRGTLSSGDQVAVIHADGFRGTYAPDTLCAAQSTGAWPLSHCRGK
ncbi:MAG: hypothetical protein M1551_08915, partial [Firmicutes bacterium]|nr:hypothetical protein [Bacillota bacterium]